MSLSNYIDSIRDKRISDKSSFEALEEHRPTENIEYVDIGKSTQNQSPAAEATLNSRKGFDQRRNAPPSRISWPLGSVHDHQQENDSRETDSRTNKREQNQQSTQVDVHTYNQRVHVNVHSPKHLEHSLSHDRIADKHTKHCEADSGGYKRTVGDRDSCQNGDTHESHLREARSISEVVPPHVQPHVEVHILLVYYQIIKSLMIQINS